MLKEKKLEAIRNNFLPLSNLDEMDKFLGRNKAHSSRNRSFE